MSTQQIKKIYLARPRGFCAGVDRAIDVVELALEVYGPPIYVKHAIVHNKHVVRRLEEKGARFTDDIQSIPEGAHTVFSAHGSPPEHFEEALKRKLHIIDATCPLVTKVHLEVQRFAKLGYTIIMVGHKGHVEPIGTLGNTEGMVDSFLVESLKDVASLEIPNTVPLAVVTQTTLSLGETKEVLEALKKRFPHAELPKKEDICYATTNRQSAVKKLLPYIDLLIVVGSQTSSNSNRLREMGVKAGTDSYLIDDVWELKEAWWKEKKSIGLTSGASVPEDLVEDALNFFKQHDFEENELGAHYAESVYFSLPHDFVKEVQATDKGTRILEKHSITQGQSMTQKNYE